MTFVGFVDDSGQFALDDRHGFRADVQRFKGREVEIPLPDEARTTEAA